MAEVVDKVVDVEKNCDITDPHLLCMDGSTSEKEKSAVVSKQVRSTMFLLCIIDHEFFPEIMVRQGNMA